MGGNPTDLRHIPGRASLRYSPRFNVSSLNDFRRRGDPPADAVAAELHRRGQLTNIHDLLGVVRELAATADPPPRPITPTPTSTSTTARSSNEVFRAFLRESARVPAWADRAKIDRAQRVHCVHTPFMGLSLFSGSLVGGSQFRTAAVVTAAAGNITSDPTRRIRETGLLLAALAFPGSLVDAGAEAHDSLTRVRLLHAALRHWLPRSGRLDRHSDLVPAEVYVEGELPLNQHDLALTLGIFCYLNLRSLRRMGVVLSSADLDAYVHMWRYAGHVLGIDEALCPRSLEEQEEFMRASMLHQGDPDSIGGAGTEKGCEEKGCEEREGERTGGWTKGGE